MATSSAEKKNEEPKNRREVLNLHSKTLLKSESLYQYILDTTVVPREPDCLRELREITAEHPWAGMASLPDEVQFISMLLKIMNAKNTLEIGVFTGYSVLATALALPDDGKILALDINRKSYDLGLPVIQKAGVEHKIDFREGPALTTLDELLAEEKNKGAFGFAFVDADKFNYYNYHQRMLQLVRVGGVIAYDNTLWGGSVAGMPPDSAISERDKMIAESTREFNKAIAADHRVEVCQLSIADGLTLCRRL
ncbi:caffeoyl-CoA O-methyltransferase 5-like [Typha angustifolia]|uniref:caffeoyl-CoA O-methyltransferase 5-like n=1 Tax=Typha angustifolia TaxID=59011 RepID=UPI003C2D9772